MSSEEHAVAVFGVRDAGLPVKTRACAYVVIANEAGLVAAVRGEGDKRLLPGGGIEPPETAAEAVRREAREELGYDIRLTGGIGHALQHFISDGHSMAMHAAFYSGILGDSVNASPEYAVEWVTAEELHHACHSWAARRHLLAAAQRQEASHPAPDESAS